MSEVRCGTVLAFRVSCRELLIRPAVSTPVRYGPSLSVLLCAMVMVYVLLRRWREGEGVVSDLLPCRSSGGRGRGRLPDEVEALLAEVIRTPG